MAGQVQAWRKGDSGAGNGYQAGSVVPNLLDVLGSVWSGGTSGPTEHDQEGPRVLQAAAFLISPPSMVVLFRMAILPMPMTRQQSTGLLIILSSLDFTLTWVAAGQSQGWLC